LELSATPTSGRSGRAYRQTVKTAHPDGGGDAEQFGKLQAAYDLLKDPVRRKVYDDTTAYRRRMAATSNPEFPEHCHYPGYLLV
jgi:curved DNA-binding protein CbpA